MAAAKLDPDNAFLKKVGARLKVVRKQKGYSNYEDFANKFNINRVQYGRYEVGQNLTLSTLKRLLDALEISSKDFFSEGFEN